MVGALLDGDLTFGELAQAVDGIAPTILTSRLRSLQRLALVTATPYERRPAAHALLAHRSRPPPRRVDRLADGVGRRREGQPAAVHAACGTALQTRPWCPTCDQVVTGEDADELIWC